MKITSYSDTGRTSSVTVSDQLFGVKPNQVLMAQAVRVYLSNLRQATAHAKTRSEVNRTKKKWYKQKGTGNARHGARTAHIFVGGGVAHGPNAMKHWKLELSKKQKRQALISALSLQAPMVKLVSLTKVNGKTKEACQILQHCQAVNKVLLVMSKSQPEIVQSFRNLNNVLITSAERLTALEVMNADHILLQKEAVQVLENRLLAENVVVEPVKVKTSVTKTSVARLSTKLKVKSKIVGKTKSIKTKKTVE